MLQRGESAPHPHDWGGGGGRQCPWRWLGEAGIQGGQSLAEQEQDAFLPSGAWWEGQEEINRSQGWDPSQMVGWVKKRDPVTSITAELESPAASARMWTRGLV